MLESKPYQGGGGGRR
jgi:hypothetical protein